MPSLNLNGYNVGTDAAVTISDSYGDVFSAEMLGHLVGIESASDDTPLKVTPISNGGIPIYQTIWNGVSGTMSFVRTGPAFTQMVLDLQELYYTYGLIPQMSMACNIRNRDGTIDEYLYSGMQISKPSFGSFAGVKEVTMKLTFHASQITATGSNAAFLAQLASAANL